MLPEALSTIMINAQKKICIKIGGKIKITYTFHFLEIINAREVFGSNTSRLSLSYK